MNGGSSICLLQLSPSEHSLGRRLNFAPASARIPKASIVAAVESGLKKVADGDAADDAQQCIAAALVRVGPPTMNLFPQEQIALKELRKANDLVILPADKGRASVIRRAQL